MTCCIKEKDNIGQLRLSKTVKNRIVLVNSFFGFEKACALPPNVNLTGPLVQPSPQLLEDLSEKSPEVAQFLD